MIYLVASIYIISLFFIFLFSLNQLHLTWHYLSNKNNKTTSGSSISTDLPLVTVQLPIYNERYVAERLIQSVVRLSYPKEKLEIQILNDSTDQTTQIIAREVDRVKREFPELNIIHIQRPDRTGYKAGALQHGLESCNGEFIAIFDADFLPGNDFLLKTVPHFRDKRTGLVQTRWGHLNEKYSLLTRLQAFGLDAHFSIEQTGRSTAGSFINFNGTAGVWRKTCILDAGGWSSDTLTEDLDLSYRAQLKQWKFKFMEDVVSPAELPVLMSAVKSQQYRWNKGAAETACKNLPKVLSSKVKWIHKAHAVFHLLNSSVFVYLLLAAVFSIPMLFLKNTHAGLNGVFQLGGIFLIGFFSIAFFYWAASKKFRPRDTWKYYLSTFPLFLTLSMGLSFHNALAVLQGYLGIKSPFVRTPKFNITDKSGSWKDNIYIPGGISMITVGEGLLSLYFAFGIGAGIYLQDYGLLLFHLMLFLGFATVFTYSVRTAKYA